MGCWAWLESKEQIELASEALTVCEVVDGGGAVSEVGLPGVDKLGFFGFEENGEELREGLRNLKRFEERVRAPCLVLEIIPGIWWWTCDSHLKNMSSFFSGSLIIVIFIKGIKFK